MTLNLALAAVTPTSATSLTRTLGDLTLRDRSANVKDFGATGDGITDDWPFIMAAYNYGRITLVTTGTNQTAAFTGQIAWASSFNGTVASNTLTVTGSLVGTIVAGQTVAFIVAGPARITRTILANTGGGTGVGSTWSLDGAAATSIDPAMFTNCVLVVSSLSSGTISVGDTVLGTGVYASASFNGRISGITGGYAGTLTVNSGLVGTLMVGQVLNGTGLPTNPLTTITANISGSGNGSTWTVTNPQEMADAGSVQMTANYINRIQVQMTGFGTPGGNGVYVLTPNGLNVSSEPMTTVGNVIPFAGGVPAGVFNTLVKNVTNPRSLDPVLSVKVASFTSTAVTLGGLTFGLINSGDTMVFDIEKKGIIYFPPGIYKVSQPIDYSEQNMTNVIFRGEIGASTIVGNFPDYVLKRRVPDTAGPSGVHTVENITVINNHANGGGVSIGYCVGVAVRNCVVTANRGINTASDDLITGVTTQECSIENCTLSPGTNTAGSIGIMSVSDGPILNCSMINFDKGVILWGQTGAQSILGCHFELCGIGVQPGVLPNGGPANNGSHIVSGCSFKNCGTAIIGGAGKYCGLVIEGTNGALPGGANPQYGLRDCTNICIGITVKGQFDIAGVSITGNTQSKNYVSYIAVQSVNTGAGQNWVMPAYAGFGTFLGCNVPVVFSVANLPAFPLAITTISWDSGTGLTSIVVPMNVSQLTIANIRVSGVTPSGYNGTFSGSIVNKPIFNTLQYAQTNPGGPSGSGAGMVVTINLNQLEGDCYNVSDSGSSAWGTAVTTTGSTRANIRWDGTQWVVMGI